MTVDKSEIWSVLVIYTFNKDSAVLKNSLKLELDTILKHEFLFLKGL